MGNYTPAAEMVVGPFYGDGGRIRSDIRDGQPGADFELEIVVLDTETEEPLSGMKVDIWHASASGHYSGYDFDPNVPPTDVQIQDPTLPDRFLRGAQVTDGDGRAVFLTVFPSWYMARAPHIHLKMFSPDGQCVLTTQLFIPKASYLEVYQRPEYQRTVVQELHNDRDTVIALTPDRIDGCWIDVEKSGDAYHGRSTLLVDPSAESVDFDPPDEFVPPLDGLEHDQDVR